MASSDAATVFEHLKRRRLRGVDDCRIAWERAGDPLALCVAVMKTPMPAWLADALLAVLFAGDVPKLNVLQKLWNQKAKDSRDALRAWEVVKVKTHPDPKASFSWDEAHALGEYYSRTPDSGRVTPAAVKKSHSLVSKRVESNPGRYYCLDDREAVIARRARVMSSLIDLIDSQMQK
jgi:hypothetical protein